MKEIKFKTKYRAVFFDLDGTLFDTSAGIYDTFDRVFKEYGREVDRSLYPSFIGPPVRSSLERFFESGTAAEAHGIFRAFYSSPEMKFNAKLYDGIEDVLKYCKDIGMRVYTATSKSEIMSVEIIEKFGISAYFDRIYGADANAGRVEKADVLSYALAGSKEKLCECLLVGDTVFDVSGAKAAGIDCLAVLYGFGKKEEMTGAHVAGYAESTGDIIKFFEKGMN
ncbi:MAG: HAD hydrolase-like protein [Clostridiales bacterium]|jgi:phosphoglycolate phosphatase|nr:HAD hydrolase-like protein [Clostridiales bacterium]